MGAHGRSAAPPKSKRRVRPQSADVSGSRRVGSAGAVGPSPRVRPSSALPGGATAPLVAPGGLLPVRRHPALLPAFACCVPPYMHR